MSPGELKEKCIADHILGCRTTTLTLPANFKRPNGFPRGELLSVNAAGERNYAFDPLKLLAWLRTFWTDTKEAT